MTSKTKQPDLTIIEGCLIGLTDYLHAFGLDEDDPEQKEKIYEKLKKLCPKPSEEVSFRRTAMRTAVEMFSQHCQLFADFVLGDVR